MISSRSGVGTWPMIPFREPEKSREVIFYKVQTAADHGEATFYGVQRGGGVMCFDSEGSRNEPSAAAGNPQVLRGLVERCTALVAQCRAEAAAG